MARHSPGDGDACPLFPEHGQMVCLLQEDPPMQFCPAQIHDGKPGRNGVAPSRNIWPYHGFEDTVKSYFARLDKAIREATIEDLEALEVL